MPLIVEGEENEHTVRTGCLVCICGPDLLFGIHRSPCEALVARGLDLVFYYSPTFGYGAPDLDSNMGIVQACAAPALPKGSAGEMFYV